MSWGTTELHGLVNLALDHVGVYDLPEEHEEEYETVQRTSDEW
jgi:hypothetical protein